ncbi:MAG TPA: amino acid racemase [Patescibacteria group bacterium]|nr:amino acid racemase [Patescibacteria group bacterium]
MPLSAKKPKAEKVVGILGGMGPFATADFFKQVLTLTPAKKDWEHLHILIDNNVKIPSRTRAVLYHEKSPVPAMIKSINRLAQIGADFVVVPCNSAHYFYEEVIPFIKIPWLNMLKIASETISVKKFKKPLVLGGYITTKNRLYSQYFPKAVYLSDLENQIITAFIEEIKLTSNLSQKAKKELEKIIHQKRSFVDCILLACSELSIAYKEGHINKISTVDVALEYARATVKFAFH